MKDRIETEDLYRIPHVGNVQRVHVMVNNPFKLFAPNASARLGHRTATPVPADADAYRFYHSPYGPDITISHFIKNPANIKSSDAITRDTYGKVIPLSKRHDWSINDLRYSTVPLLLGVGAASDDKE